MSDVKTKDQVSAWLADWISKELGMPKAEIETSRSLLEYSLSSVTATILVGDLEDWLDLRLPPTLVWDYPSIDAMTEHLMVQLDGAASPAAATPAAAADAASLLESLDSLSEAEIDALLKQLDTAETR